MLGAKICGIMRDLFHYVLHKINLIVKGYYHILLAEYYTNKFQAQSAPITDAAIENAWLETVKIVKAYARGRSTTVFECLCSEVGWLVSQKTYRKHIGKISNIDTLYTIFLHFLLKGGILNTLTLTYNVWGRL